MKRYYSLWLWLSLSLGLTSCGEIFELSETTDPEVTVTLDRDSIDLMVGDQFGMPVKITPDSLHGVSVYWEVADNSVIRFNDNQVFAVAPGRTTVKVSTNVGNKSAQCVVTVYPKWQIDPHLFQYDMMVYANVTLGGKPIDESTPVAAFATNSEGQSELRGVGRLLREGNIQYMLLRVYSNDQYDASPITFRCYDRTRAKVVSADLSVYFISNASISTLSNLSEIAFE